MSAIKEEHKITYRGNRGYITYAGYLNAAHSEGLCRIETELLKLEVDGSFAAVKATVETSKGTFSGLGDANSSESGPAKDSPLRMAETRAKRRALRDAVNMGEEELEDLPPESQPAVNGATPIREAQHSPGVEPRLDALMQRVEKLYFEIEVAHRPPQPWEKIRRSAEKNEDTARGAIEWLETFARPKSQEGTS